MALTKAQITEALALLASTLDPLKNEGARTTIGPVLKGPISKGEFQCFYGRSNYGPVELASLNGGYRQLRTTTFQCVLQLADLSDQNKAIPVLEQAKTLTAGLLLFGLHVEAPYQGGLYPQADSFTRLKAEGGGFSYLYALTLACATYEYLPEPV